MAYPRVSTRKDRDLWYKQVDRCGKSVKEVCRIFGISRQCYYEWHRRDFGFPKSYQSPKRQPNTKLTPDVKRFIEKAKWKTNYGPEKMKIHIKQQLGQDLSTTIIYRYYKRKGLIRKPQRPQPWYEPLKTHLVIQKPGEGVQMDIKYIYEQSTRKYLFSALDPYTEKYHFKIFASKHSLNVIDLFQEAEVAFGFKIISVQTDNGSEFRGYFHNWLGQNHVPHFFIPKRSPYWNGKVERVHRTIDDEYFHNPYRVWRTPYQWLQYYNFERLHLSLNGLTPQQAYLESVTLAC